ncbi:TlpA family protein disulfide reductase [Gracilibacillus dipsosauri]|uniref:Cytochrome C biogenesis protein n=1 Tax=Gracilibacillus dipsosauri TaxID=178340 RepID=A0A317KZ24_9BACI|nr:TlpA disulfide reductase family protein [Gracilibacillus dipsosauri]PWU68767.1 cytochrome C biogenesis protein [Gracilibacillus dipsosauri]
MKKNIIGLGILVILTGIVIYTNFTNNSNEDTGPNEFDVTGDTSVEGGMITSPNHQVLEEGDTAPIFHLKDLQGQQLSLSDVDKDLILVNFWATWCKPCVEEMPAIQQFEDKYGDQVKVLAINATATETKREKIRPFVEEGGYAFTILLDEDGTTYENYSIIGVPSSFFIDSETLEIVKMVRGPMTLEQMEQIFHEINS